MDKMESDNIYDRMMELFGKIPENFSILEEQIDIKTQMNYFELSKKYKQTAKHKQELSEAKEKLFLDDVTVDEKKEYLIQLANSDDVEAFRLLEKFNAATVSELKDWSALALQESRMTLESSLLDENQVIISTGLGGKGKRLRYFAALASKDDKFFTVLQKKLIEKEIDFTLKKHDGEIEKIEFDENYCSFLIIVPLNVYIKDLITAAIDECNQIGDFIDTKFILTNVKIFSKEEIMASWKSI
jgi:hypothetical protein